MGPRSNQFCRLSHWTSLCKASQKVRSICMSEVNSPTEMQGCVEQLATHAVHCARAPPSFKPFRWPGRLSQPARLKPPISLCMPLASHESNHMLTMLHNNHLHTGLSLIHLNTIMARPLPSHPIQDEWCSNWKSWPSSNVIDPLRVCAPKSVSQNFSAQAWKLHHTIHNVFWMQDTAI